MVLADDVQHLLRQARFPPLLQAELHVALDHGDTEARLDVVVLVLRALVLHEVLGVVDLADVVVDPADPGEHRIGPDGFGRLVGELTDVPAVVVRSLGHGAQALEDR